MNQWLKDLFKNNGKARGVLYLSISALSVIAADLTSLSAWLLIVRTKLKDYEIDWVDYVIAIVFVAKTLTVAALVSGNTLRAFIDQHLSRETKPKDTP